MFEDKPAGCTRPGSKKWTVSISERNLVLSSKHGQLQPEEFMKLGCLLLGASREKVRSSKINQAKLQRKLKLAPLEMDKNLLLWSFCLRGCLSLSYLIKTIASCTELSHQHSWLWCELRIWKVKEQQPTWQQTWRLIRSIGLEFDESAQILWGI